MRNITSKIYSQESFTKSYKTTENADKAIDKAFDKLLEDYNEQEQNDIKLSFSYFLLTLDNGRFKPIVRVGSKHTQIGIDFLHQGGFTVLLG